MPVHVILEATAHPQRNGLNCICIWEHNIELDLFVTELNAQGVTDTVRYNVNILNRLKPPSFILSHLKPSEFREFVNYILVAFNECLRVSNMRS